MAYPAVWVLVWMVLLSKFEVGLSDGVLLVASVREREGGKEGEGEVREGGRERGRQGGGGTERGRELV